MGKIVVAGSINMDVVARSEHHPVPGETVIGSDLQYFPGGKGSNQAVAAGRIGGSAYLVGKLGKDAFGNAMKTFLEGENLLLDYLTYSDTHPTGVALIVVNAESENTIVVVPGSNGILSPADVSTIELNPGDVVLSQFEIPQETVLSLFQRAKNAGATTILNPAPAARFVPGLAEAVDYLVVNETELAFLSDEEISWENIAVLHQQSLKLRTREDQVIIVTLGAKGLICVDGDDLIEVPGFPVEAVDTTGAGDCFVGALAASLADGHPLVSTLRFATAAAALSVQCMGASPSMPGHDDVLRLLSVEE